MYFERATWQKSTRSQKAQAEKLIVQIVKSSFVTSKFIEMVQHLT